MDRSVLYGLAKKANESQHNSHTKGDHLEPSNFVRNGEWRTRKTERERKKEMEN